MRKEARQTENWKGSVIEMEMTPAQKERTQRMMAEYAKEDVTVQAIKGTLYVFGSELACLRIYHKYRFSNGIHVEYSTNLQTWFFSMPMGMEEQPQPEKRITLNERHFKQLINGEVVTVDAVALILSDIGFAVMQRLLTEAQQ